MSWLQALLLYFTILATLYQMVKMLQIHALVGLRGELRILPSFYMTMAFSTLIQTLFVLSMVNDLL